MDAVLETDNSIEDLLLDDGFSPAPGERSKPARIHKAAAVRAKGRQPHRKRLWILLAAAAGAAAVAFGLYRWQKNRAAADIAPVMPTASVERMDIEKVYNASGTVISAQETTENARQDSGSASGYLVKDVLVKVGDRVSKGDTLYTIDMSDTEQELAMSRQKLANTQAQNSIDQAQASRYYQSEQQDSVQQYQDDTRMLTEAADDTNKSIVDQAKAERSATVAQLEQQEADAQKKVDALRKALNAKQAVRDSAAYDYSIRQAEVQKNGGQGADSSDYLASQYNAGVADADYAAASAAYGTAQEDLTRIQTQLTAAKTAESSVTNDYRSLEKAGSTAQADSRAQWNEERDKEDAIGKQKLSNEASLLDLQDKIRQDEEKLSHNTVTAAMDGTVTSVNVTPGQLYSGTNAVVINNVEKMKVTASIDEGHIADIAEGMKVRVKTASTGDTVLEGKVIYTAITPAAPDSAAAASTTASAQTPVTSAVSTASKKPVYRVDIELNEPNERLRIGMTAKIDFILAEAGNCLAVPTADIQTGPDGETYVTGADDTGAPGADIPVKTGIADAYHTQVLSGDLQEGDIIFDYGSMASADSAGTADSGSAGSSGGLLEGIY